jgi:glutamate N-acetyltransferase/amino-acid N-acetyltransferase
VKFRYIKLIPGGVCQPEHFRVNARAVPFHEQHGGQPNVALIACKTHCATACAFSNGGYNGACNVVTAKHFSSGYARAVVLVGESAIMNTEKAFTIERICREVAKCLQIPDEEVFIATNGALGQRFEGELLIEESSSLANGLVADAADTTPIATAIHGKQAACIFELSNFKGKIGAVYSSDGATTCMLTTDVAIAPDTLQKALSTALKETFYQTAYSSINSPNDYVGILANGGLGNYKISCEDTEYKKFLMALEEFLAYICRDLVKEHGEKRLLTCTVKNTKSKRAARAFAKAVVSCEYVKRKLSQLDFDLQGIVGALNQTGESWDMQKMCIVYRSNDTEFVLFEDGIAAEYFPVVPEIICEEDEVEIRIDFKSGNYGATAYTGVYK